MKPDDNSPEEMLDDIREKALRASQAASDLSLAIYDFRNVSHDYYRLHRGFFDWWKREADRAMIDCAALANEAEELADAEGETAEGGEE